MNAVTTIDAPTLVLAHSAIPQPTLRVAEYEIKELLGRGSMGQVFRAESADGKVVAIKFLERQLKTAEKDRSLTEWEALSRLNHLHIAKLLGSGYAEDGRAYLVMEYVEGRTLSCFADENQLSIRNRIKLMLQICDGIRHAHQKGIIHRDLKPANILVTTKPPHFSKIIDFGLAKLQDDSAADRTMAGMILGTPLYMAPEQMEGWSDAIDIRVDVYSMGAILYELLTGSPPAGDWDPTESSLDVIRRIRTTPTEQPADRVVGADPSIFQNRRITPVDLVRVLNGDLGRVVMKALERDREMRYGSAEVLAADLKRVINGEPIHARSITTFERFQWLVRRNPLFSLIALIASIMIVLGLVGSTIGLVQAHRAERIATERMADLQIAMQESLDAKAQLARSLEESKASREAAERQTRQYQNLTDQINAIARRRQAVAVEGDPQLLADLATAIERLKTVESLDPETRIWCVIQLCGVAATFGDKASLKHLQEAVEWSTHEYGSSHSTTMTTRAELARCAKVLGEYPLAAQHLELLVEPYHRLYGPLSPKTLLTESSLAQSYARCQRTTDAVRLIRTYAPRIRGALGPESLYAVKVALWSARVLALQADPTIKAEGAKLANEFRDQVLRQKAPEYASIADQIEDFAMIYVYAQAYVQAEQLYRMVITQREASEPHGWLVQQTKSRLSRVLIDLKRFEEAEPLALESLRELHSRRTEIGPRAQTEITLAYDRVTNLYREWGRTEQLKAWQSKHAEYGVRVAKPIDTTTSKPSE